MWTIHPDLRGGARDTGRPPAGGATGAGGRTAAGVPRMLGHAAWISVLCGWAVYRVGRFGFTPTDDGFILGLSWRILHGEIPHVDVVSARPLGSALLHTVDFLLPGPLFVVSQAVAMAEIVLITVALAVLVTRRPLLSWGPARTGLVAAAALVNLHTFALGAWHTIDGLAATACGWWALDAGLRSGRVLPRGLGLLLLGFAALTKQSFALAVPSGLIILWAHPAVRGKRGNRTTIADLLCLGAAPLAYFAAVTAAGGLPDMIDQLTGATPTAAQRLFAVWATVPPELLLLACATAALLVLRLLGDRLARLDLALVLGIAALVVQILVTGELSRAGDWGIDLFWLLVFVCAVAGVTARRVPWRGLAVAVLAWMCSLSWGYDSPTLLGGTLALTALYLLTVDASWVSRLRRFAEPRRRPLPSVAVGLVAVLLTGSLVTKSHDRAPYRDRPQGELTAGLGGVAPSMRGIRSTPAMHRYVQQIRDCTRRFPASRVAVLPDNAFVYPALGLHNPFPLDWPLPIELVADARERMLATADRLARTGDYLVLFQTVSWEALAARSMPPSVVAPNTQIVRYGDLEEQLRARLTGRPVTCGSFVGIFSSQN